MEKRVKTTISDLDVKYENSKFIAIIILLVGINNLVTLIFTKTTFCHCGNTKGMVHILSYYRSSRPIRTPLKSINHASKYIVR